jgi:hypothetical protein
MSIEIYLGGICRRIESLQCAVEQLTAALVESQNTSTNKPSATCLLCGHKEVCYYYKHSGGGCCGKFVPRTSHVG